MKQFCIFLSLFLSVALATLAQDVTNVRVHQEGEQIIITYDLDKTAYVHVYVATGQSNQYAELKAVVGNVGKDVQPGTNRRITWTPLEERTEFVAQNVRFRVSAMPNVPFFWVSPTKAVIFSPGNLQYRASTNTWRFAPHQWEYIGKANGNISKTYDDWIDLFGWGAGNNPTKSNEDKQDYQVFVDWGVNTIGTDRPNTWRTLTIDEWDYLFKYTRWTMATVNGVLGFMLLPDDFSVPTGLNLRVMADAKMTSSAFSFRESDYITNQYTVAEFDRLETIGCVFLPCAGYRIGAMTYSIGMYGYYWSTTSFNELNAKSLCFYGSYSYTRYWGNRCFGQSVRLVQDLR